eukprot:SAG31_NODE_21721_length_542_cov_1.164786_1_plen_48_part_01
MTSVFHSAARARRRGPHAAGPGAIIQQGPGRRRQGHQAAGAGRRTVCK